MKTDKVLVSIFVVALVGLLVLLGLAVFAPESVQLLDLRGIPDLR